MAAASRWSCFMVAGPNLQAVPYLPERLLYPPQALAPSEGSEGSDDALVSNATQAAAQLHELLCAFMARLAQAAKVSGSFYSELESGARQIGKAHSLRDVTALMQQLLQATQSMARDSRFVHDELQNMQAKVQSTDQQIARLHAELDRLALLARHDPLTGALNRKGMDEAVLREASKVRRLNTPLSIAMLDIDDFKKLNDTLGHAAGDAALRHLAVVARECLRPQDTMARYGGEEFLVLLPDTTLERGVDAVGRLQRELAQRPFPGGAAEQGDVALVHITFSAGVSQMMGKESPEEAFRRADEGMYRAKRAGKNRVVGSW
jgi:diguanylate cyclase